MCPPMLGSHLGSFDVQAVSTPDRAVHLEAMASYVTWFIVAHVKFDSAST